MLSPKARLGLGVVSLLGFQLLADPANPAAPPTATTPERVSLRASVQAGEVVGFEQFSRVFMNAGGRRLMFVVPQEDFRAETSNPQKIVLVNRDYTCVLSFQVRSAGDAGSASLSSDLCRAWLSAEVGELVVLGELTQSAANCRGPAFDYAAKPDGVSRSSRVAFIPSPVGILEFKVSASPEKFSAAKSTFQGWLRSFQISDAQGRLKIAPVVQGGS